jgi:hypothetical protein
MSVRKVHIPQFAYVHTTNVNGPQVDLADGTTRPAIEVSMTTEELRPEFLRVALEAQLVAIKEEHAKDPAFDFMIPEEAVIEEMIKLAYEKEEPQKKG